MRRPHSDFASGTVTYEVSGSDSGSSSSNHSRTINLSGIMGILPTHPGLQIFLCLDQSFRTLNY